MCRALLDLRAALCATNASKLHSALFRQLSEPASAKWQKFSKTGGRSWGCHAIDPWDTGLWRCGLWRRACGRGQDGHVGQSAFMRVGGGGL